MLSIVFMNKRSILTAVLALGLGITALTGCATDSAHSYVTPKDVKTVERPIAQIDDSGIKVPEKRDLKVKLPTPTRPPSGRLRSLTRPPLRSASPRRTSSLCTRCVRWARTMTR